MRSTDLYLFQETKNVGPSHITVKEERAPTDESIRIYQEMLQKAERDIIKLFKVDDNQFKCTLLKNVSMESFPELICLIELNGQKETVKQEILSTQQETITALYEKMGLKIAEHMIAPALNEFMKQVQL